MNATQQSRLRPQPAEVAQLIRPVRWRVRAAIALTALSCACTTAGLLAVAGLADALLVTSAAPWGWLVGIALGLIGGVALRILADVLTHQADADLAHGIRHRLADALERAPFSWFQDHPAGGIRTVVADDVTKMHHLVAHSYTDLTAAIAAPGFAAAAIAVIDVRLLLVLAVPVVAAVFLGRRMSAVNAEKMPGYGAAAGALGIEITEFLDTVPLLRSFGRAGALTTRLRRADTRFVDYFLSWAKPLIQPETLQAQLVSPVTLLAIVIGSGTAFVAAGWTSPLALIPVALLGLSVSQPLTAIADNSRSLQMARGSAKAIQDILDTPGEQARGTEPFPPVADITLDDVSYERDGTPILDRITLRIAQGAQVAIVGPSGAGKTTLARIIVGLITPSSGSVHIGDVPLSAIDRDARRSAIGYLGQHSHLLRASVAENITLTSDPDPERIAAALRAASAEEFVQALPRAAETIAGEEHTFSGGQQQRLAIARVAYLPPRVLVLDEPTARVDVETEHDVQRGLASLLAAAPGTTTVVVSHRLETIADADSIIVLDSGSIVQQGAHEQLLAQTGLYRRLWNAQLMRPEDPTEGEQ
ncbi:ABC transporter ATP-binding protein [Microbacterium saperdae]|uniref:ATP-binding cassette subfamily B protein n=1 Tax=Microbacterium saperdae TaxID=69368 RepID=A0A543BL23_9MICO|nr:ABC transporter ATP-binding protein [Microbacterium saperdae]TQL85521.1 ATP-binding cassette subfamily B protein [Microbacterium saperdae]GGM63177.1 ABC transporter ATP-binding protein [Microbacterium saperdae]